MALEQQIHFAWILCVRRVAKYLLLTAGATAHHTQNTRNAPWSSRARCYRPHLARKTTQRNARNRNNHHVSELNWCAWVFTAVSLSLRSVLVNLNRDGISENICVDEKFSQSKRQQRLITSFRLGEWNFLSLTKVSWKSSNGQWKLSISR